MRINSTKEGKKGFVVNYSPQREPAGESLCLNGGDWWLRQTMPDKDFDNVHAVPSLCRLEHTGEASVEALACGIAVRQRAPSPCDSTATGLTKLKSLVQNLPDSPATAESGRRADEASASHRDGYISCTVPGSVQTALMENELVPMPPYFGSNIRSMESATLGKQSWFFKRFDVPTEWRGKLIRLRFEAVDYKATFYLNDQWLGTHEGHFSPASFDVSNILQFDGNNVLAVQLDQFPPDVENPRPGHILDRAGTARSQILKNELTDCTPAVCPLGITDDVFLLASDGIYVEHLWVRPKLNDDYSQATISLQLMDKYATTFGIRKIEMVKNEGHADSQYPWTFVINGQKIYGKGGNWVPMDSFHRMDSARYERLLRQARAANFNIIR